MMIHCSRTIRLRIRIKGVRVFRIGDADELATFTPPTEKKEDTSSGKKEDDSSVKTGSAWDELRNRAAQRGQTVSTAGEKKEKNVWGDDE
jgi:hypothetical protein